jgi:hypothetical protein
MLRLSRASSIQSDRCCSQRAILRAAARQIKARAARSHPREFAEFLTRPARSGWRFLPLARRSRGPMVHPGHSLGIRVIISQTTLDH